MVQIGRLQPSKKKVPAAGTPTSGYDKKPARTATKTDAQRAVDAAPKKSINGMAPMAKPEVKKAAKKTVKAAKKAVKAAVKTVKKAASGKPLGEKNTYTTSGTHAGGRKSSASRPIKKAASLKRARATSLRVQ